MTIRIMGGPGGGGLLAVAVYNVADYGAACDGTTDDSAAVQACINDAHTQTNGGQIIVPGLCRLGTGIVLPYTGNYTISGPSIAGSVYAYVQSSNIPAGGFITSGDLTVPTLATAPATYPGHATYLFYAAGDPAVTPTTRKRLTVRFENLLLRRNATSGAPQAIFLDQLDQTGQLDILGCEIENLGLFFRFGSGGQMDMTRVIGNTIVNGGWVVDQAPAWQAIFAHNGITNAPGVGAADGGSWDNLSTKAQILECTFFWTYNFHHNVISSGGGGNVATGGTLPGAMIYVDQMNQTQLGSIDHNAFYGCSDAGIYIQSSFPPADAAVYPQGGIGIYNNAFTQWNVDNITSALAAAIYIDAPLSSGVTDVQIGPNRYFGKTTYSKYGIVVVGDPVAHKGITIDPHQLMAGIATAAYRVNGTNSGGTVAADARSRIAPPTGVGLGW
jgi:hypothetical protein